MKNRGQMILYGAAIVAVFVLIFVFLTRVHPMVVFDGDDWGNLSYTRLPLPLWGIWNPAKVLPEILMPIMGYIGAFLVYPLLGDYLSAITYSSAFVVALMFTILCYLLDRLLITKYNLPSWQAMLLVGIFIAAYFGLFKSDPEDNKYMLWVYTITCCYHYVIPSLLNASLVLFFISKPDLQKYFLDKSVFNRILIITAVYFAIYSNIFQSLILAVYCGSQLIYKYIDYQNIKDNILNFLKGNSVYIGIISFWLFGCIFEANGGRSASLVKEHGFLFKETFSSLVRLTKEMNHLYLLFLLLGVFLAVIIRYRFQDRNLSIAKILGQDLLLSGISGILVTIGLLLVSAKAGSYYAGRIDAMYGIFFYILLFVMIVLTYILKNTNLFQYLLPLIFACCLMVTLNSDHALAELNYVGCSPSFCAVVSNDFIRQIKEADHKGLKEMTLAVPKWKSDDNWPHPMYLGPNIANTLYVHGLIAHKIKITIKPDIEMNKKYNEMNK